MDAQMTKALSILKIDLGIVPTNTALDDYLEAIVEGAVEEINGYGADVMLDKKSDFMLILDYSAWMYRKRANDTELRMPKNIWFRICSHKVKKMIRGS